MAGLVPQEQSCLQYVSDDTACISLVSSPFFSFSVRPVWASVAFIKICPAGKGYFLQHVRDTVAFSPRIYTIPEKGIRKPDKTQQEGESPNKAHTSLRYQTLHHFAAKS